MRFFLIYKFVSPFSQLFLSKGGSQSRREIHLMHFTTGKCHKSATVPVVPLKFRGTYNDDFGTRIEIMGRYLVVLLAHSVRPRSWHHRHGYQTLYLVDWVKGRVICVCVLPPTAFAPLYELLTSLVATTLPRKYIFSSPGVHLGAHLCSSS